MRTVIGLVMLALGGCGEPAAAKPDAPGGPGAPRARQVASAGSAMQTAEVIDRSGFAQPIVAASVSVPAGWRTEGGVNWDDSTPCATNRMKFQWRAVAPDGIAALEMLPGYSWQSPNAYVQMNPCPVDRIASAQEMLMTAARVMRPGAQVIGYRQREDLLTSARSMDRGGATSDVGELRLRYSVADVPVEEVLSVVVSLGDGGGGTAGYLLAYRAPAGRLDSAVFDRMRASFRGNPQFLAAIGQRGQQAINSYSARQSAQISAWHNARMAEINAKGAADRAAIRSRGNAETNAIYAETAAGTQATNDGIHDSTVRAIREEQTWSNPATGQVAQGSIHGGQRVIEGADGRFTRTDDPYYMPPGRTEYVPQ